MLISKIAYLFLIVFLGFLLYKIFSELFGKLHRWVKDKIYSIAYTATIDAHNTLSEEQNKKFTGENSDDI